VSEFGGVQGGGLSAYRIVVADRTAVDDDETSKLAGLELTLISTTSSRGAAPCCLTVDRSGSALFAANYGSGTVAMVSRVGVRSAERGRQRRGRTGVESPSLQVPLHSNGRFDDAFTVVHQHHGSGVDLLHRQVWRPTQLLLFHQPCHDPRARSPRCCRGRAAVSSRRCGLRPAHTRTRWSSTQRSTLCSCATWAPMRCSREGCSEKRERSLLKVESFLHG
jgi:DNA-binding beta-propeller fold protein YncE